MESQSWERLQSLFLEALERAPAHQSAFLDEACGEDLELRQELAEMLAAHADDSALAVESWLPWVEELTDEASAHADMCIGSYRTKRLVGRGGMGEVYLAERDDDHYQQEVALKLLAAGQLTADALRRFRAERQILARLVHPNIARLLDGGVSEDGRPYLVMEFVAGRPITEFCDAHQLPIEPRLQLFLAACAAVQFAHRNLIVHRDLKPSNVLVSEEGEVKLLDFGIAKLLDPELAGVTGPLTQAEFRVMTPECAAPEQVRGEAITTATDVYALGVLLYELLSGHRPYQFPSHQPAAVERIICGERPTPPSTRVTSRDEIKAPDGTTVTLTPERVCADRATAVGRLRRVLHGDLDNIVMMALRKEPERRYASAAQLADDIRRYLQGRPILARTDTFAYRTRRFMSRNRWGVGIASAFALLLLSSAILTAWQSRQVARQRDVARQETAKAEQVTGFLLGLFDAAAPTSAPRDTLRLRELLEAGRERAEELAGQPGVQAEMFTVLSQVYWRLGRSDLAGDLAERAVELQRQVFGSADETTAAGLYWLAVIRQSQQRLEEALALYRECLELRRALHGARDPLTLKTQYRVGLILHMDRQLAAAESLLSGWEEALVQQPAGEDADLAITLSSLGVHLHFSGRLEEAETALRRAIEIRRGLFGEGDFRVGDDLNALAGVLIAQERAVESEAIAREALSVHRALFPDGHFALGRSLDAVGEALIHQGRYAGAEPYLQEALSMYRKLVGDDHGYVARGHIMLGQLYHQWGRFDEAEFHYRQTAEIRERLLGHDYLMTIQSRQLLAGLLRDRGDYAAAERILTVDHEILRSQRGADDRYTQAAAKLLVELHEAWGSPATTSTPQD